MIIELACGANQADVALLDQIEEWHTSPDVFLGNADDQPAIGGDQMLACRLA
jgi:hypothetical protein